MPGSDEGIAVHKHVQLYCNTYVQYIIHATTPGSTLLEVSLYMHTYIRLVGLTVFHPHFSILRQHSRVVHAMECEVE